MVKFPEYKITDIEQLIPYARNSNTHSEKQITKIAASIKEFGFLNPIILDGANGIVAGHCRVLAAKKLGMTELPCIDAKHLTEAQRRAYVIADNRLARDAETDAEMLRLEFDDLTDMGFDLELTGFEQNEIEEFKGDAIDILEIEGEDAFNFIIKCSDRQQLEDINRRIGKNKKATYEDFINCVG